MSQFSEQASSAPSQKEDSFIYAIAPLASNGIAAITSADELLLLDRQSLQAATLRYFTGVPAGVTCMVPADVEGTSIICTGRDGVIALFDIRSQKRTAHFREDRPITALACSGNEIAIGTELENHQAVVSVWDIRQNKQIWKNAENNDDITDLHFHPLKTTRLLSGGIDGLVSIFDTTVMNEEDSLVQVVNHGPIHKAGFLSEKVLYALSSDENLSLHPVSSDDDNDDPQPIIFGDLRLRLGCEYAVDMSPRGFEGFLAVGSHSSNPRIELRSVKDGKLTSKPEITLLGAHGEDIVRSLFAASEMGAVFTAGEDGKIRVFSPSTTQPASSSTSKARKLPKSDDARFRPY